MVDEARFVVVFITTGSHESAEMIGRSLLENKMAACVNVIPGVDSSFWWQGKIEKSGECLLVIKTKADKLDELIKLVKQSHKDKVPEIIAMPIIGGNPDYLKWIDESIEKNL